VATFQDIYKLILKGDAEGIKGALKDSAGAAEQHGGRFATAVDNMGNKFPGLTSKLQSFTGNAEQGLSQALPGALAVGAAAVAGFGIKAVSVFQDSAQQVLTFQRVAGTTAEESSRWVEAFHDYGISAETAGTLVGKFEKAIGTGKLTEYGIAVKTAKDGTTDMQGTLLNAVDAFSKIEDPAKRATVGTALFGKSWETMLPILDKGKQALQDTFAATNKGQILSQSDLKAAEDFRLAWDDTKDAIQGAAINVGRNLIPILDGAATIVTKIVTGFEKLTGNKGGLFDPFGIQENAKQTEAYAKAHEKLTDKVKISKDALRDWGGTQAELKDALDNSTTAQDAAARKALELDAAQAAAELSAKGQAAAAKELADRESREAKATQDAADAYKAREQAIEASFGASGSYADAQLAAIQALKDEKAAVEAATQAKGTDLVKNLEAESAQGKLQQQVENVALAYAHMTGAADGTPASVAAQIKALDDLKAKVPELTGVIDAYIAKLLSIPQNLETRLGIIGPDVGVNGLKRRASGGLLDDHGQAYTINEGGPEGLMQTPSGTQVINAAANRSMGGGSVVSGGLTVNVTALDPKAAAQAVIEAIKVYERNNGKGWRS
jgi:hypothetical protein